jgi:hypothetical protein
LTLWAGLYTAGWLRFEKWGHIDKISNLPPERALFVDYDAVDEPRIAIPRVNSTFRAMGFQKGYTAIRYARSKRGWHLAAIVPYRLSPAERVAAESILGDDPMRAAMNFARSRNADKMPKFWKRRWNIFYDYKFTTGEK